MGADHDKGAGARTRAFLAIIMGVLWVLGPMWREYLHATPTYAISLSSRGLFLGVAAVFTLWARDSMTRTRINRQVLATLFFGLLGMVLIDAGNILAGVRVEISLLHHMAFIAGIFTMAAIAIDLRMWPSALGYAIAFIVAGAFPALLNWCQTAANLVILVNCTWV
jgi:hypothetical protein